MASDLSSKTNRAEESARELYANKTGSALPVVINDDTRDSSNDEAMNYPDERAASRDDDIPIPDFKLIRRIGSGAYGEVWLAQAITGALRAVKIVWREDFDFEKTFHREFEGIQQFEPISRGHKGLVNVLHVGWNEMAGFYYYVMELGDDAISGAEFDIDTYVPRTLATDFKNHGRLHLDFCKDAGIFLADALGYMHSYGLTHRDIKPSNIIFVKGVFKLADIGLVAAHGERSFVGTEGYVPPEGPGTFAADIYSLGKVLYEISSGKDRMDFPEVPEDLTEKEWVHWREWNEVICKACAPNLKDRFASAAEFAVELQKVGVPKPMTWGRRIFLGTWRLAYGALFAGVMLAVFKRGIDWQYVIPAPDARKLSSEELAQAKLPRDGRMWLNSFDIRFIWQKNIHVADKPVDLELFNKFLEATMRSFEGEVVPINNKGREPEYAVVVPKQDATSFCDWLTDRDRMAGALSPDFEYAWKPDNSVKKSSDSHNEWSVFRLELTRLHFGQVIIESTPPNAEVLSNGELLGATPLKISRIRVGNTAFVINMPGYKRELLKGNVEESKALKLSAKLRPTDAVAFGRKWKNSLGMELVPLGNVLISTIETRRADYVVFLRSLPTTYVPPIDISVDITFPITHVNRQEAEFFCKWLTFGERKRGLLDSVQSYRLPTDDEWSMAAGLPRERGNTPAARHQRIEGFYPWGFNWPPQPVPGNLWDKGAAEKVKRSDGIENFNDAFPELAPSGSFPPDPRNGIRDLTGNVWEWIQERYGSENPQQKNLGVVRGGSWKTKERGELLASYRKSVSEWTRSDEIGFRIVLSVNDIYAREDE